MKERKELIVGDSLECWNFVLQNDPECNGQPVLSKKFETVSNAPHSKTWSVFRRRKLVDKTIKASVSRETRATVRVQGVTRQPQRPLVVTLAPGDVITFRPKGTRQAVTVPIMSLYHFARFTAARAVAAAKREAGRARK